MQYWLTLPYLGFGTGAHGNIAHVRTVNMSTIDDYLESMKPPENRIIFPASMRLFRRRKMMEMQIVMSDFDDPDRVDPALLKTTFGIELEEIFHYEIERLLHKKLIEVASMDGYFKEKSILIANPYGIVSV